MTRDEPRPAAVLRWIAKLTVVALFTVVGFLPKFTGNAAALAERVPGGEAATILIGVIELVTIVLILIPRTALLGSVLAVFVMLGAIASHFGPVGFDGDFRGVFIAALIALVAALTSAILEWKRRALRPGPDAGSLSTTASSG